MTFFNKKILPAAILALLLSACGNDKEPNNDAPDDVVVTPGDNTKTAAIKSLFITDANNNPITTGSIQVLSAPEGSQSRPLMANHYRTNVAPNSTLAANHSKVAMNNDQAPDESQFASEPTYVINADGTVDIEGLVAGDYYLLIKTADVSVITSYHIQEGNILEIGYVNVPIICSAAQQSCEATDNIVGSITGVVSVDNKPIANAQVSLSGGAVTNGAFANAITDADGMFVIPFNVANDQKYVEALQNAVVTVTPTDYETFTFNTTVNSGNVNGLNIGIEDKPKTQGIYWQETFEDNSATASLWQIFNSDETTGWMVRASDYTISNNLVNKRVNLAPNDTTQGLVPLPLQANKSFWYGNKQTGNFLGKMSDDSSNNDDVGFDGGTSMGPNRGDLTSPSINLTNVTTPVSLSFKTWWEIESVNPNINGFDVMTVSVAVGGSNDFVPIARLNPLTDPEAQLDNAPLPFTTGGFNQAPKVIQQEGISLDDYKGQVIRLRFNFDTNDELYNGFRGWMVDDILITDKVGTFPKYDNSFDDYEGQPSQNQSRSPSR
ncbi:MAG: hypothetical protein Q4P13_00270 [Psychrobacter sp.]|nr:hypothetical protein [Psychrobacter sp.]